MGVVYLGRDPVIGRLVALKTIRAVSEDDVEQREFQERFLREAQAAGILSHPNIVTVHDVGEDSSTETSFIAMEYVEGKNLKQLLTEKTPFSFERVAEIIGAVAEALDYAHRRGIVHRDVKPANIIITPENQVKITDFGIAKTEKSNLTTTGQFLGTPNYMSPEQVTGDAVDGRSDLFSLGVVLYELLTRKKPFTADNLTSISYKIVHEQFVAPETYDAGIPQEFTVVLEKALAKDPAERFQRGNDFALSLYEYKAREEERQMLRDLGQMVAEAERLGPVATGTAPPSPLQQAPPEPPAPAAAAPVPPPVGRSPFDILAASPVLRENVDELATREVSRPLPATAFAAPPEAGSRPEEPGEPGERRPSGDWQLDEPTRSKKPAGPGSPGPADEVAGLDADASLPGPEVAERAVRPPRGLAVSPLDEVPSAPGVDDERPEGATEIIDLAALAKISPAAAGGVDRPTEILRVVPPPVPESAPEPAAAPPEVPEPYVDRPTEILRAIPPPVPEPSPEPVAKPPAPPAPYVDRPTEILSAIPPAAFEPSPETSPAAPGLPVAPEPYVDRPTEILRAVPPPAPEPSPEPVAKPPAPPAPYVDRPTEILSAIPPPAPATPPVPERPATDRPTEILRSPFPSPVAGVEAPPTGPPAASGVTGEEAATERIVDALKLSRSAAPAAPAARAARAATPAPPPAPPVAPAPPGDLPPIPTPPAKAVEPEKPMMKRAVNMKFVVLILGAAVLVAAVVGGVLWSKKTEIEARAAVDEVREREVLELKTLMDGGNGLLAAGNPEQALEKFREVIRRKPDSAAAREAVARAEEQLKAMQAGAELTREVETRMAAAREAAELGEFDRALDELSAVLLLEPENADALAIRESVRAAQEEKAAADRKARAELARKKRPTPVPTPTRTAKPVVPVEVPKPATPTPGSARLRIVFQSPAPEGYVMVRRNDKEIFRRQFDFGRKSSGGLVEGTVEVPSGPANIKAWAIPTDRSFNGYEPVDLVIPGGETRTLVLELNAAKKLVVSLR